MSDPLLQLVHEHRDAILWLQSAVATAGDLCIDGEGKLIGWKAAEEAADRLGLALGQVRSALEPLAEAIREAQAAQDEAEDRWGAQRM